MAIDALWAEEAEDRIDAFERGEMAGIPAKDIQGHRENRITIEIIFLPPAKPDLVDATFYYNMQSEGLGYEFATEVKRTPDPVNPLMC